MVKRSDPRVSAFWVDRRPALIQMHKGGMTISTIAAELGCSGGQVSGQIHQLRRRGLLAGAVTSGSDAVNAKIKLSDEDRERFARLRRAGVSHVGIGKTMGISRDSARRLAKKLGFDPLMQPIDWSAERDDVLCTRRAEAVCFREIAREIGISDGAVRRRARKLGLAMRLPHDDVQRNRRPKRTQPRSDGPGRPKSPPRSKVSRIASPPKVIVKIDKPPRIERPAVERAVGYDAAIASFKAPATSGVSIIDLDMRSGCRWPFDCDDGQTRYCNAPATDGSWCAHHGARVFNGTTRIAASIYHLGAN